MNITYKAFGTAVLALDLDQPNSEPTPIHGQEQARAFATQPVNRVRLVRCAPSMPAPGSGRYST